MTKELKAIRDALNIIEAVICHDVCSSTDSKIADTGNLCMEKISTVRTTLDSIIAGGGWMPIESAPKDGTTVLGTNGEWIHTIYWSNYRHTDDNYWNSGGIPFRDATHWMHLPAAPKHGGGLDNQTPRYGNYNGETK